MRRFIAASEDDWTDIRERARNCCLCFRNAELPRSFSPMQGDVGFEIRVDGSALLLIRRGQRYQGSNAEIRAWVDSGTIEFPNFESLRAWTTRVLGAEFSETPRQTPQPRRSFISRLWDSVRNADESGVEPSVLHAKYRVKDGSKTDYSFSFEKRSEGDWRVYILKQPDYRGRDTGSHSTHRLTDGNRKYICWSAAIPDLKTARQVAALWADATQEYIRSGKRF